MIDRDTILNKFMEAYEGVKHFEGLVAHYCSIQDLVSGKEIPPEEKPTELPEDRYNAMIKLQEVYDNMLQCRTLYELLQECGTVGDDSEEAKLEDILKKIMDEDIEPFILAIKKGMETIIRRDCGIQEGGNPQ